MGGVGSGQKEKPVCKRCGEPHWLFVRCEDGPADNIAEVRRRHEREGTLVPVPLSRAHSRPGRFTSGRFVMQAPGVYRRQRD